MLASMPMVLVVLLMLVVSLLLVMSLLLVTSLLLMMFMVAMAMLAAVMMVLLLRVVMVLLLLLTTATIMTMVRGRSIMLRLRTPAVVDMAMLRAMIMLYMLVNGFMVGDSLPRCCALLLHEIGELLLLSMLQNRRLLSKTRYHPHICSSTPTSTA